MWQASRISEGEYMNWSLVPKPVRKALHPATRRIRRPSLIRAIRRIAVESDGRLPTVQEAQILAEKWSNSGSPAAAQVVVEAARLCRDADGPVLECGSGITTFVAAIYARHGCWSLENSEPWRRVVVDTLQRAGLPERVLHAPLIDYGDFDWYQVPDELPKQFEAVICDGPAGTTRGGRGGLLPVMGDRIAGATVLLDDADREGEQAAITLWSKRFGVVVTGSVGSAALLRVEAQASKDGNVR